VRCTFSNRTMLTPISINKKATKIIAVAHMKTSAKYDPPSFIVRLGGTTNVVTNKENRPTKINRGRWTLQERLSFLRGLRLHGKSKWKEISKMIPTRYVPSFSGDAALSASTRAVDFGLGCHPPLSFVEIMRLTFGRLNLTCFLIGHIARDTTQVKTQ
jgi:hypothetical protein